MKRVKFERVVSQVIVLFFIFSQIGFTAGNNTVPSEIPDSNSVQPLQKVELDNEALENLGETNPSNTTLHNDFSKILGMIGPPTIWLAPFHKAQITIAQYTDDNGVIDEEGLAAYLDELDDSIVTTSLLTQLCDLDLDSTIRKHGVCLNITVLPDLENIINSMNNFPLLSSTYGILSTWKKEQSR